ncbi:MAG: alanine racemase [Proteobacteria bacterium]|nr:alanine racemase [Pseudomonadota bacterium]
MTTYPKRPTVCEINLQALQDNYTLIKNRAGKGRKILAVVKADAYGHGAVEVSKSLEEMGVDALGVAILEEALRLRENGITSSILILGGIIEGQEKTIISHKLTPVIFSLSAAKKINNEAKKQDLIAKVHVKIDTGMGRLGIQKEGVKTFFKSLKDMTNIEVEGVLTHFASADFPSNSPEGDFTQKQIKDFEEALKVIEEMGFIIPLKHAANSAAIFNHSMGLFNMVRPGIMLYGSYPSPAFKKIADLKEVMSFKTKIIDLKDVEKGFRVSYGSTYVAPGRRKVAVLPVGYADGYRRELSGKGEVLIRGQRAPVIGRICMDMTMVDVTGVEDVSLEDDVFLFGGEGDRHVSIEKLAEQVDTIAYELLCGISQRVPRVYI